MLKQLWKCPMKVYSKCHYDYACDHHHFYQLFYVVSRITDDSACTRKRWTFADLSFSLSLSLSLSYFSQPVISGYCDRQHEHIGRLCVWLRVHCPVGRIGLFTKCEWENPNSPITLSQPRLHHGQPEMVCPSPNTHTPFRFDALLFAFFVMLVRILNCKRR